MVGTQLNSVLATIPTVTDMNQLTELEEVTDLSCVTNVVNLQQASIDPNSVEGLPFISIVPCQDQIIELSQPAENTTTNPGQVFVLAMTVDSGSGAETEKPTDTEEISAIAEPQRASTPKLQDDKTIPNPNETILAGNIDQENTLAKINKENIKDSDEYPSVGDAVLKQDKKGVTTGILKPCRQIQLEDVNATQQAELNTIHNETYCKNWVAQIDTNVMQLAQVESPIENTSLDLSSLNITSVSRNKPEYSSKQNEKFVSQKTKKSKSLTLQQKDNLQNTIWYIS